MRRLSYCFILLGFLFIFACATDSGIEEDTAATMNPTSSQPQYPAFRAGATTNPQTNATTTNSDIEAIQQQNMQQQMMQRMQENMQNSPGMGMGGGKFGGGNPMGSGIPR